MLYETTCWVRVNFVASKCFSAFALYYVMAPVRGGQGVLDLSCSIKDQLFLSLNYEGGHFSGCLMKLTDAGACHRMSSFVHVHMSQSESHVLHGCTVIAKNAA